MQQGSQQGAKKVTQTKSFGAGRRQASELRRSKAWEQVLPPPESPLGQRWIKTLRERLFVHLPNIASDGERKVPRVADDVANSMLANVWKRKVRSRASPRARAINKPRD